MMKTQILPRNNRDDSAIKARQIHAFGFVFLFMFLLIANTSLAQSGQVIPQQGYIEPHQAVQSPLLGLPPAIEREECGECKKMRARADRRVRIPSDPRIDSEKLRPTGAPTDPGVALAGNGDGETRGGGTFTFFRNHALTTTETGSAYGYVMEPTFGVNGRTVFWAGNFHAAVSGDYGQTFSYVNPGDNFPADGVRDLVLQSGFCCDQIVYYDRTRGAYFWLLLYHVHCDVGTNVQRIAVANSQEDVLNNNWFWYDFTPASYGFPESGIWLDFPYLTVSGNYLYHITKVLDWNPGPDVCPVGAESTGTDEGGNTAGIPGTRTLVARYPLDQMSRGQGMTYAWLVVNEHGARCTHGAGPMMYFGAHKTSGTMRIYRWADAGGPVSWDDVDHGGFNTGTFVAPGPDGLDWAGHMDSWIQGAWVARGVLGFMFGAAQGGGFPYPHVQVLRFRESDRTLLSQEQVWHPDFAWLYPAAHPNDRGHVGGTMVFGGGINYPGAVTWIADDFNGGVFQPLETRVFALGESGPIDREGMPANRWGDYLTARRNVPYGNTWGGSGHSLVGGGRDANAVGRYVWFGRERDRPPSSHTIYVDHANRSGYEDGTTVHPYDMVREGHVAAIGGDTIIIRSGNYPETVTLSTPTIVLSEGGIARIGE